MIAVWQTAWNKGRLNAKDQAERTSKAQAAGGCPNLQLEGSGHEEMRREAEVLLGEVGLVLSSDFVKGVSAQVEGTTDCQRGLGESLLPLFPGEIMGFCGRQLKFVQQAH